MTTPPLSFDDVRRDQLTVVGDDVYDLGRFAAKHPGGREVSHLRGTDATLPLVNAHGIQGELPRLPKAMRVGVIDPATLDATDRDLRALLQSFRERGLFRYRRRWLLVDALRGLGLFAIAWLTKGAPWLSFGLFTIALLNVMWWVHDVCHDSVFSDRQQAKRWAETASILFVGTPVLDYQYVVHRVHHGYTNVIGADQALDTGPVIWDERMRGRTLDGFVALQAWAWFFLVLPLTFPLFLVTALYDRVKARDAGTLAIVLARWAIVVFLFRADPWLLAGPVFCAGYALAFVSSLNHFHKPLSTSFDPNFARSVTRVTQNLRHRGPLATWLTGGLNFHIEHHLFATMPRHNYRVIAPEVRAFCARHGLPYATCSFAEAVSALWGALRRPAGALARLAVPPAS